MGDTTEAERPRTVRPVLTPAAIRELRAACAASTSTSGSRTTSWGSSRPRATRRRTGSDLADFVSYGASPRATLALLARRARRAFLAGRGYVLPEDVKDVAPDVLRHRVLLSFEAEAENVTSDEVVQRTSGRV